MAHSHITSKITFEILLTLLTDIFIFILPPLRRDGFEHTIDKSGLSFRRQWRGRRTLIRLQTCKKGGDRLQIFQRQTGNISRFLRSKAVIQCGRTIDLFRSSCSGLLMTCMGTSNSLGPLAGACVGLGATSVLGFNSCVKPLERPASISFSAPTPTSGLGDSSLNVGWPSLKVGVSASTSTPGLPNSNLGLSTWPAGRALRPTFNSFIDSSASARGR